MFRTMVVKLPEYTKDSDAINRLLNNAAVPAGAVLISMDVKRLYPSIILNVCMQMIERFLRRVGCSACERDLLLTCLRLVLTLNFCHFNDKVFYQILGFATGVTCGAEAADLYLHELLALAAAAELYSTSTVLQGEITEITAGPTNVTATRLGVGRVS